MKVVAFPHSPVVLSLFCFGTLWSIWYSICDAPGEESPSWTRWWRVATKQLAERRNALFLYSHNIIQLYTFDNRSFDDLHSYILFFWINLAHWSAGSQNIFIISPYNLSVHGGTHPSCQAPVKRVFHLSTNRLILVAMKAGNNWRKWEKNTRSGCKPGCC